MTTSFFEKIKPLIDSSLVSKFDVSEMYTDEYIPICVYKGAVCIISTENTSKKMSFHLCIPMFKVIFLVNNLI